MRLLVLGASGGVGRLLTRMAADAGHSVTVVVRPSTSYDAPSGTRVIRGEVLEPSVLASAVIGQDAVASCLGLRRASRLPWAPLRSPPDLTTRVTGLLIPAMNAAGVHRIVAISAGGVAESITRLSAPVRWMVSQGNVGVAYRDLAEMERLLSASGLDWLAVRPVTLVDGPPTGRGGPVTRYGLFSIARRADVAQLMLGALARPSPFTEHTALVGTV
jgi:uncharacterized protein YbjT (DUF2867 family)